MSAHHDLDQCYCELLTEEDRQQLGNEAILGLEARAAQMLKHDYAKPRSKANIAECLQRCDVVGENRLHVLLVVDILLSHCTSGPGVSQHTFVLLARADMLLRNFTLEPAGAAESFHAATNALADKLHKEHFVGPASIVSKMYASTERERFKDEEPVAFAREKAWSSVHRVLGAVCCQVRDLVMYELEEIRSGTIKKRRYWL